VESDLVTKSTHDVVTVSPEADDDTGTSKGKDPQRNGNLRRNLCTAKC